MVGIIDYGAGNFTSVLNAITELTDNVRRVTAPEQLSGCTHIVLPGVGAYGTAIDRLQQMNIIPELNEQVLGIRKPFLGICVGMQVMSTFGLEFEKKEGLNWIAGDVQKFDEKLMGSLHLPHMGWNEVVNFDNEPLFKGIRNEDPSFYFVHSYHFQPVKDARVSYTMCNYGYFFPAAVRKENIFGVQFHPEKSQYNGIQLLKNFIEQ